MSAQPLTFNAAEPVYGKYEGTVLSNADPENLGRITALVPKVLGTIPCQWARPCVPYAGIGSGFFSLPPPGAGVWIEFLAGDVAQPIWTGCFWGAGQTPPTPPAQIPVPTPPTTKIWRSETGLTVALDDLQQQVTICTGVGIPQVLVDLKTNSITLTGAAIQLEAPRISLGEDIERAVLGNELLTYLTTLVAAFNLHMHPGQATGPGGGPVTPAPPLPRMLEPTPTLLSPVVGLV